MNTINNDKKAKSAVISSLYVTKFSRDIYLPSLPAIATALSATHMEVKYTVALYFFSLAISRFLWTPLSDIYGRRKIMLTALPIFLLGTLVSLTAVNFIFFLIGRLLQGFGIGCCTAIGRAIVRDIYQEKTTKGLAYLSLFAVWAPAIATVLGGHLQTTFGWRANFAFLFICGVILLTQVFCFLPETSRTNLNRKQILIDVGKNYFGLLKNRTYLRYLLTYNILFSGTVVYYVSSPFLFIHYMHITPHIFGYFAFFTVSGMLLGKIIAAKLSDYFKVDKIVKIALGFNLVASIGLIAISMFLKSITAIEIMSTVCIYFIGMGILSPTSKAASMAVLPERAGTASALFGVAQGLASTIAGLIVAHISQQTALPMGTSLLTLSLIGTFIFVGSDRNK